MKYSFNLEVFGGTILALKMVEIRLWEIWIVFSKASSQGFTALMSCDHWVNQWATEWISEKLKVVFTCFYWQSIRKMLWPATSIYDNKHHTWFWVIFVHINELICIFISLKYKKNQFFKMSWNTLKYSHNQNFTYLHINKLIGLIISLTCFKDLF